MLNGLYIIDDVDIWQTYGAVILRGSYDSLFSYPARKTPDSDDWFEQDFIDVDYSNPFFDATDVVIKVGVYGVDKNDLLNRIQLFKTFLNRSGERILSLTGVGAQIRLRYKGGTAATSSILSSGNQFYLEQDLQFSNDDPIQLLEGGSTFDRTFDRTFRGDGGYSIPFPYDYIVWNNFEINGKSFIDYGMAVTSFNSSSLVFDELKEPLLNTYTNRDGIDAYVSQPLKSKARNLSVGLVMAQDSISKLMNNYNSFWYELSKPSSVSIHNKITNYTYYGFYTKQESLSVSIASNIKVLEFTIELTITQISNNG